MKNFTFILIILFLSGATARADTLSPAFAGGDGRGESYIEAAADTLGAFPDPAFAGGDGRGESYIEAAADTPGAFPDPAFAGGDGRGDALIETQDSSPFAAVFFSND